MKNQERLFLAIGGADPALVARSEGKRRARWPGYCLAACLALVVAVSSVLLWRTEPAVSPPDEQQPPATVKPDPPEGKQDPGGARPPLLQPPGSELGTLRMVSYTVSSQEKTVDFLIYVNEEQFTIREEDGLYSIRSKNPLPDSFPECGLDIFHIPRTSVVEARAEAEKALTDRYAEVILGDSAPGLYLRASNGTDWDSEQAEFSFVTDGQGGVFVIVSRYFLEAEEGLGMRFRDMASSFRVVSLEKTVPEWMRSLYETADRLFPALLSNNLSGVSDLLAEGAEADAYGEDVSEYLTVASVDYVPDNDQDPASATVSVKHRLNLEEGESYNYLTMELVRRDGQWKLAWSGIEK